MRSKLFKFALIILTIGILSACGGQASGRPASAPTDAPASVISSPAAPTEAPTTASSSQTATVSFANDILPLLQSRCVNCHGGDRTQEGLSVKTYADLMSGSKNGPVITAGNANDSLLADLVATQKMPKRGPKLTPPQVQLIIDWINQGALDN